jgi:DNA mismatch repair protein MutL
MTESKKGTVQSQGLLVTESVTLMPADAMRVRNNIETLRGMGIGVAEFGGDSFVVDALPACLAETAADVLLKDIAAGLEEAGARGSSAARQEIVAQAACKASVRARDRMNLAEIEQLVVDLARTEMPYTCPHGRPTLIFTSFTELRRKFGRE